MRIQIQDFSFEGSTEELKFFLQEVLENHLNCIRISFLNSKASLVEFIEAEKSSKLFRELVKEQSEGSDTTQTSSSVEETLPLKEKKSSRGVRAVIKLDKEGNVLEHYTSAKVAAHFEGISRNSIYCAINKQFAIKGFYWKYADSVEVERFSGIQECMDFIQEENKKPYEVSKPVL